jgi:hypothetical protein
MAKRKPKPNRVETTKMFGRIGPEAELAMRLKNARSGGVMRPRNTRRNRTRAAQALRAIAEG